MDKKLRIILFTSVLTLSIYSSLKKVDLNSDTLIDKTRLKGICEEG